MSTHELDGRRVIITGSASGMGEALTRAFPTFGARVVGLDVTVDAGQTIARESGATFAECDVTSADSVNAAFDAAATELGGLDVLIHCAGIAPAYPSHEMTPEQWTKVMAVNATGTMLTNQAAYRQMVPHGFGRILDFASAAGVQGYPSKAAYAASKGAVVAWVRTIAAEWGPLGITVNAIAPAIKTPMYERTRASMTPEQLAGHDAMLRQRIPIGGQLGDVDTDLVPVLAFLAGDGARFMTGQVFSVDGGTLMMR